MTAAETIRAYDNTHIFHPWEAMADPQAGARTILARGEGIHVWDAAGRRLIDGPGGMWCVNIGHGRREMAEAIGAQALRLAYHSPWGMAGEPSALLAKALADRSPGDLNTVFFTTGGSTAVDTALRFCHYYNNAKRRPAKKIVISRAKAYHGSTYLSASASGKERDLSHFDTDRDRVAFIGDVNPNLAPPGMTPNAWCDAKVAELEGKILELGADRVAAFIAEPILASGGVIVPPPGYHAACLAVCRRHDVLYIADEVVTAFGRLGHWFASEEVFGMVPDIITTAKGLTSGYLPLGACLISDRLVAEISGPRMGDALFSHGYTYSGHPVACAAALTNIEVIEREGLLAHARAVAPRFQARLAALAASPIVGETRGIGLVGCVEGRLARLGDRLALDRDFGARIDAACEARGLIVRPIINMCVFSPPLIITVAQIDEMFDILGAALAQVADEALDPAA